MIDKTKLTEEDLLAIEIGTQLYFSSTTRITTIKVTKIVKDRTGITVFSGNRDFRLKNFQSQYPIRFSIEEAIKDMRDDLLDLYEEEDEKLEKIMKQFIEKSGIIKVNDSGYLYVGCPND